MLRVGLTGGIGSGKSTVAGRLAERGAMVIDADRIAREVVEPGTPGLAEVVDAFGADMLAADGWLNRPALADLVFADAQALARLNAIVHPRVAARTAELLARAARDTVVVHDVPLLVENGLAATYHLVLVVDADVDERVRRLVRDRGMTERDARARIAAQTHARQRRAVADVWLDNSGPREPMLGEVDKLWADRLVPYEANVRLRRYPPRGSARLVPYNPTWPEQAERLAARLRRAAGAVASRVDHIGSTAVPGLAAKDVLDFQVTVTDLADADRLADPLADAGFPRCAGFTEDTPTVGDTDRARWAKRTHASADPARWANVHVRAAGSPAWRQVLLFRDWLRANDTQRREYEAIKHKLAAEHIGREIPDYAAAKTDWLMPALRRAEQWAEQTDWSPRSV